MKGDAQLQALLRRAESDERILAVILFGSVARGCATAESDIDVCLVLSAETVEPVSASEVHITYAGAFDLDVAVFQLVPLYVRQRVLRDGKVLYVRDEDRLYDIALRTVREFEDYRPLYRAYLEDVARGGS